MTFEEQNYNAELEKLPAYVKNGSRQKFIQELNSLLDKASQDYYSNIVNVLFRLYISIMHIPSDLGFAVTHENRLDAISFYKSISQMQGRQELLSFFSEKYDHINNLLSAANQKMAADMTGEMLKYIQQNYANNQLSCSDIAGRFSISPQYFSKVFFERTGENFSRYLNKIRLEKAKELLCKTDKSTIEICRIVGYANRSYFSSLFKQEYGLSPSKFKLTYRCKQNDPSK